jgi:peroxiredoxin
VGDAIQGTGKLIGDAGKAVVEGGGKVLDGAGKVVIDGGGKLLDGAGKVVIDGGGKLLAGTGEAIGGAGVAIGKAVGDVMVTAFSPGTKAPDFKLRDLDGRPIALADFRGSPVVLAFCTTSYPPCVVEMRHLRDLQAKYEGDNLKVIVVALDWEGPAALRRFQQEMGLNYPLVWDNGEVFKSYTQVPNVPTTFFIDKNGHIVKKRVGFASATIVTQGAAMVGTSMIELDKGFEKDLLELLKK